MEQPLNLDSVTKPTSSLPPLPGANIEVLHGGQWVPGVVLLSPNDKTDPQQKLTGWKVKLFVGGGIEKYVWKTGEIREP